MKRSILFVSCLAFTVVAQAQQGVEPDSLHLQGDTLIRDKKLDEVVILTYRGQNSGLSNSSILSLKDIEQNYTGQEPAALLSQTPGINWYSDGGHSTGYTYMRIRGIDQTRINFMLDGVPLNEPEDQGVYFSNYPDFLNSVNSISVQRGVGISGNGMASLGGSVNFESASLTDSAYTSLQASGGSWLSGRMSSEFSSGVQRNGLSLYGRFSASTTEGFRDHSGNNGGSFFLSSRYAHQRGVLKITGFAGRMRSQMSWLAVPQSAINNSVTTNINSIAEADAFNQQLAMVQYTRMLKVRGVVFATAYYNRIEGGYSVPFGSDFYEFNVASSMFGSFVNYNLQLGKYMLRGGLHASYYFRDHFLRDIPDISRVFYKNRGIKSELTAFVRAERETAKWLTYTDVQLRTVQFSYIADPQYGGNLNPLSWVFLNPKIGAERKWREKLIAYAFIGFVSREPTRNDLFAGADNPDTSRINLLNSRTVVYPESVLDFEAGVRVIKKKVRATVNFYWMQFNNEIAAIGQLSNIGLQLRENVSSSFRRGFELELRATPFPKWEFMCSMNVSQNRIELFTDFDSTQYRNVVPLLTPAMLGYSRISYQWRKNIAIELNAQGQTKSYLTNSNKQNLITPAFIIAGTAANFQVTRNFKAAVMVNNILNTRYSTSGYAIGNERGLYAMAGRNFFTTLTLTF
ncbi:MAG: TonB-dependent receptor [Bacteroidia bacterium]|jgi:iron complex outermembrane receptor protein|nr:TonB-dependent receptor [Bacteroidia bacterium]